MTPFVSLSNSLLVMTVLMLASGWVLTTVRRAVPSAQRSTGAFLFVIISVIATQVMLPLPNSLLTILTGDRFYWAEISAAPIVIALAIILSGIVDGVIAAIAVLVTNHFSMGQVSAELVLVTVFSVACGIVVRHFWGLHRDFITTRLLLLMGLGLAFPMLLLCYGRLSGSQADSSLLAALVVVIVAYPLGSVVFGNLMSQPYHQMILENQLLDSQERNRQMVRLAGNAIINFNADLEIIDYNEEAERVFGYPRQFVIGRSYISLLFPGQVWPDIESTARRVLDGGQIREHEVQVLSRDGDETPMIWSLSRITNARDEPLGIMAIGQDISLRKRNELRLAENEERVRLALSGADLGMWDWNLATEEFVFSERWAEMLGYSVEELQEENTTWDQRIHSDDREHVVSQMERHLNGETDHFEVEHRLRHRDGSYIWVLARARVIQRGPAGEPLRMTGTLLDISDRVSSELDRQRLEQQLRYSQKMETIGTLAGGVAHDFNNILQAIIGYSTLSMTRLPEDHPVQQDMQRVLSASERARTLVDQMLVFSRQTEQNRDQVDVEQVCSEVLRLLEPQIDNMGNIAVEFNVASDSPSILADPTQIHQVVMNLATNAVQSMKESGGTLGIHLDRLPASAVQSPAGMSESPHAWLRIIVSDNGCGISEQNLGRLFEPFFTTKSVEEGTGLGLSVVHGIITNHGGAIEVDSSPGNGSRFTVLLPVMEVRHHS